MKSFAVSSGGPAPVAPPMLASIASGARQISGNRVTSYPSQGSVVIEHAHSDDVFATATGIRPARACGTYFAFMLNAKLPGGFLAPTVLLTRPLAVQFWQEGDEFVAAADDIGVYAFGATTHEAISNLKSEIVDHFYWLENAGDRLTPRLKREREHVRSLVSIIDA